MHAPPADQPAVGFLGSLREFGASLLATMHSRVELVALELQEEKLRLVQTFVWISAVMFALFLTLGFASVTVLYLTPPAQRPLVLVALSSFYLLATVALTLGLRRHVRSQPRPFNATLEELEKDRACIPGNN